MQEPAAAQSILWQDTEPQTGPGAGLVYEMKWNLQPIDCADVQYIVLYAVGVNVRRELYKNQSIYHSFHCIVNAFFLFSPPIQKI